ncbi:rhomboid family intramembrane serine protease [Thalassomonas viridans]|uniref:Rhomboid family intramembrane serine protease n=1 Tax=Thalassomonas viridans TaxID=137584 RepID=A0AAF0C7X4_9GAMM|nr:rhomboid family intramembrane serine protease [Thalassomonas viridans]WDE03615.1 rhomboid family intramembrane serine protease [Thalassomonas viridans]
MTYYKENVSGDVSPILDIKNFINKWKPIDAVQVSKTRNGHFVLPTQHEELKGEIYESYRQRLVTTSILLIAMFLLGIIMLQITGSQSSDFYTPLGGILFFISFDIFQSTYNQQRVNERALFIYEVMQNARTVFIGFIAFFILIFLMQLKAINYFGSNDDFIISLGTYYREVDLGEYWRFFIGPFIHLGFSHWLTNSVITAIMAAICYSLIGIRSFGIFLAGAIGSHVVTYIFSIFVYSKFDALAGMSGGAYSLLIFNIMYCYFIKKHTSVSLSLISLLFIISITSFFLTDDSNNIAHMIGSIIGLVAYFIHHSISYRRT